MNGNGNQEQFKYEIPGDDEGDDYEEDDVIEDGMEDDEAQ